MKQLHYLFFALLTGILLYNFTAAAGTFSPTAITPESAECIKCHKEESRTLYQQWGRQ